MRRDAGPEGPDHSPVPGRGQPKESSRWTNHPECAMDYVASATGQHFIHVPCRIGVCSINLIKWCISGD